MIYKLETCIVILLFSLGLYCLSVSATSEHNIRVLSRQEDKHNISYATDISEDGIEFIKRFEGFRARPYKCANGVLTVGFGSTYIGSRKVARQDIVTQAKAESIMRSHISNNCPIITKTIEKPLTQNQYDSLCSFIYRVGVGNYLKTNIADDMNTGNLNSAIKKYEKFIYKRSNGKLTPLPGLQRRVKEESRLLLS